MKRMFLFVATILLATCAVAPAADIDALPPRSFLRIGTAKLRHGDRILCLAYSPDGAVLAAGGGNDPLRLWNPKTGDLVQAINEPWVQAMTYTANGHVLVFGGYQKVVRLWNFTLGKEGGRLEGHRAGIKALAVSPDNPTTTIVSGSQDGVIILWNMMTQRKVIEFNAHQGEVTALAFCPTDSNTFASAGNDGEIRLWSVETNQSFKKLDAGCGVLALAFSTDGKTLYSAADDFLIRRWDIASGSQTGTFKGHRSAVVSLFVRGDTLVSGGLDKTIRFWDAKTTEQLKSLPRSRGDCDALSVTQAGDFLATAGFNNAIRIYDIKNGREVAPSSGAQAGLVGLALSADQKRLVSVSSDGKIFVWDAQTGKAKKQWDSKQAGELVLAASPDGKVLAVASDALSLWNADTGAALGRVAPRPNDSIAAVVFAPDGKKLAIGYASGHVELLAAETRKQIGKFKYPATLHALAWSPDSKKLAAGGGPKIFVWNPTTTELIRSFDVKEGPILAYPTVRVLAFGPDSNALAAGGWDAVIRVYHLDGRNPSDVREQKICTGHEAAIFALAFSPDGRSLLSGSFDRTVRLWEAFSGKPIAVFKGHAGAVDGVAFAKDGRSFFTAGTDANIFRWDVPGLQNNGKLPELTLAFQQLDTAWNLLATEDTAKGHEMMWKCIASAKQAVPHLTKNLYYLDPDRVKKLFKDLDSDHFPTRLAAMNELTKYGRWMEGRYEAAMANPPSLEYKRRVELLREKLIATNSPSVAQERLRVHRIMLMCEQVGGAEAIEVLRKIAERGPEEELREEARASLQRLKQ